MTLERLLRTLAKYLETSALSKVRHEYASVSRWREGANILNQTVGKKRQSPPAYSDSEQQGICNAFRTVC